MSESASPDVPFSSVKTTSQVAFCDLGADELESSGAAPVDWLWEGYLAPRNVTLLTSQWKSGKTTLVAVLLSRLRQGGTFAGQPLRPGKALVVSEESADLWLARRKKLGFGDVRFLCRPFRGRPTAPQWQALIDHIAALHARQPRDLVVIDSLAYFFPGRTENVAAVMLEVLAPLTRLAEAGLSVLLLHHPRRRESARGQAARGSGGLMSFVDVLIEMRGVGAGPTDRRRRLEAMSRYDQTPHDRVIELSADGTDYAGLGDLEGVSCAEDWEVLRGVLVRAERPLALREVAQGWPPHEAPPSEMTLWRRLTEAVNRGVLRREGAGHRHSPYRYFLPEMPEQWRQRQQEEIEQLMRGPPSFAGLTAEELERRRRDEMTEALLGSFRAQEETLRRLSGRQG
jgi:hypothetical protein